MENVEVDVHLLLLKGVTDIETDAVTDFVLFVFEFRFLLRETGRSKSDCGDDDEKIVS